MPRFLNITSSNIEIYRSSYAFQSKNEQPLYKVPLARVKSASKIIIKADSALRKNLPKAHFKEMNQPSDLYKNMIQVQIEEAEFLPGNTVEAISPADMSPMKTR